MSDYKSQWADFDFDYHLDGVTVRVECEYDAETLELSTWEAYIPVWNQPDYPMSDRLTPEEIQRIDDFARNEIMIRNTRSFIVIDRKGVFS